MRFWRRKAREHELERELRVHLELEAEEQPDSPAAMRALGNFALIQEQVRDAWGWNGFETLGQDFRYAFRSMRGSPVFAAVAILSLGLGIGANTAIFSFVNALLLKRLPVPQASQLVSVEEYEGGKLTNTAFSLPFLSQMDQSSRPFDGALGRFPVRVNLARNGAAEPLHGEVVTGNYFKTLQVKPALGRLLTDEDVSAASPLCVISYSAWQTTFGGDPGIIGAKVLLNAHPYTVAGVTEKGFFGPQLQGRIDLQMPVSRMGDFMGGFFSTEKGGGMWKSSGFRWLEPLARLKPGITAAQAQTMIRPIDATSKATFRLVDGSQGPNTDSTYSKPVTVLMGIVALVLLIACANLASLLLARANRRRKEFAVRLSLGASRLRLVRQLMVESIVIACCGGMVGIGLASWIIDTLLAYLNSGKSGSELHAGLEPMVLGFSIALSLLTSLLFGLVPAWQSARPEIVLELKGIPRKADGMGIRRSLIVFQVALSLVILFAAGLLTRTLGSLKTIDLGFDPTRVVILNIDSEMNGRPPDQIDRLFDQILGRLRTQPGVEAASFAVVTPLEGSMIALGIEVAGHIAKGSDAQTNFNMVSPDYFKTLNQPLLAGRDFEDRDVRNAPGVAIVNQLFVDQYMPGQNPIGRHLKVSGDVEIVGLVGNARYQVLREKKYPLMYLPAKQTQSSGYSLMVRAAVSRQSIERTIRAVDPKLPIYNVRELKDQIDQGMSAERVLSFLSTLFSGLAILLCCMGIYGLIAYAVSRRTREIGIRFAVGAQKMDVARLFLRESMVLVVAGILVGIPLALASTRLLTTLLYGVAPGDPFTLSASVAIFVTAGLLASLLPVLKAARIEPLEALRYE